MGKYGHVFHIISFQFVSHPGSILALTRTKQKIGLDHIVRRKFHLFPILSKHVFPPFPSGPMVLSQENEAWLQSRGLWGGTPVVWMGKAPLGVQHHGLFRTVGFGGGASGWRPGLAVGI